MAVAVGRDDDSVGVERGDVVDAVVLADLRTRFGRARGEPSHEPRGLERAVAGMEDAAVESAAEPARKVVDPLRGDAVRAQRFVLAPDLPALFRRRRRDGSCPAGAARRLRALPCGRVRARSSARARAPARRRTSRVRRRSRRAAAEREAAVAAARAFGDAALVVHAYAQACFGEPERGASNR